MTGASKVVYIPRGNTGGKVTVNNKAGICPIYPVRYAYANFFEQHLSKPTEPPPLPELLSADSISKGSGYIVRLLRQGWVYIREEDDQANGYFHIFKYEQIEHYGDTVERFSKYLFKNRLNAQDGLEQDTFGRAGNKYPYVFVRQNISDISIAYSEHRWSADVIDNLNANADDRRNAMQRVNLTAPQDTHALPATADNLRQLIEDYRLRQHRFFTQQTAVQTSPGNKLEAADLEVLSTANSYVMDADHIAEALVTSARNNHSARIVALHDPVGRQKEIAHAHATLSLWKDAEAAEEQYPYTIGRLVNDLRQSDDDTVKSMVKDCINEQEHSDYWQDKEQRFAQFDQRQAQFAQLYQAFMVGHPQHQPGSLGSHFHYFFATHSTDQPTVEREIKTLCEVCDGLFDGILSSAPGNHAIEAILNDAADQFAHNSVVYNALHIILKDTLIKLLTQPQDAIKWSDALYPLVDKFLNPLAPFFGKVLSAASVGAHYSVDLTKHGLNKLSVSSLDYVSQRLIPSLLGLFGVRIDVNQQVTLTSNELARIIAKMIDQTNGGSRRANAAHKATLDKADVKLKHSQRLFDWAERLKNARFSESYTLTVADIDTANYPRYKLNPIETHPGKFALLCDTSIASVSAVLNVMTLFNLSNQSQYQQANPVNQSDSLQRVAAFTSAITALTADTLVLARTATAVANKALSLPKVSPTVVKALAPGLQAQSRLLDNLLKGSASVSARLIIVANFAGAIAATWLGANALKAGNDGEATGHFLVAGGSGLLLAQGLLALGSVAGGAGLATAFTGVGLLLLLVGLAAIIAGTIMVFIYGRTEFENLLLNCFWGDGKKYAFWPEDRERLDIVARLGAAKDIQHDERIQRYYQTELQEFMNLLNMPKLTLEKHEPLTASLWDSPRRYTYIFALPNFQPGVSEVHFGLYPPSGLLESGHVKPNLDSALTHQFAEQMKHAEISYQDNLAHIRLTLELDYAVTLLWVYEPQPGTVVPQRHFKDGELMVPAVIGMVDEETA